MNKNQNYFKFKDGKPIGAIIYNKSQRFTEIISVEKVIDNVTGEEYHCIIDDGLLELLNALHEENEQLKQDNEELKKENQGIQNKVIKLLDFVEVKQCVTRTEIKKWWNDG